MRLTQLIRISLRAGRVEPGPDAGVEGLAGLFHRVIDILRAAGGDLGEVLAGGRVAGREGLAGAGGGELAVDPGVGRVGQVAGDGGVFFAG